MFWTQYKNVSYGVIGLGRFGWSLTEELAEAGAELLVLDRDEDKIRRVRDLTENAMVVKSLDKETLRDTGIQNCDVVIVCIGEQMESSILTTLNLVSMGIPKVIAKANSPEHGEILERLGAEVAYPEKDMAVRLANRLEASGVLDIMKLSEKINISKLAIPEKMIGRTVLDMNLRPDFGLNIIAIEHHNEVTEHVEPEYVFRKDDILILSGSKERIRNFVKWAE